LRDLFTGAYSKTHELHLLAAVETLEEAKAAAAAWHPSVILIDLAPGLSGVAAARQLSQAAPASRILMLSSHADPIASGQLALAGAQGVVSKKLGVQELFRVIRETALGRPLSNGVLAAEGRGPRVFRERALTPRETEVLQLIARGRANKQMAHALGISIKTVEKHRQSVMNKLRTHETAGLTWRALCMGLAESPDGAYAPPPNGAAAVSARLGEPGV
jgi:DNA-binding NarL/FixJ family response regulator